eukprot:4740405-Amphidinium_carterae.1
MATRGIHTPTPPAPMSHGRNFKDYELKLTPPRTRTNHQDVSETFGLSLHIITFGAFWSSHRENVSK